MSNLVKHAEKELKLAGLMDKDSDYNGELGKSVLKLVKEFSKQGHSGMSAAMTVDILQRLLRYETLTPLKNPIETGEYIDVSSYSDEKPGTMLQSTRNFSVFSNDGGKRWYDIDAKLKWYHVALKIVFFKMAHVFLGKKQRMWWSSRCLPKVNF